MIHVSTRHRSEATAAARGRDSTSYLRICALGVAICISAPALTLAQARAAPARHDTAVDDAMRPFRAQVPDAEVADMRRRLQATRWPDR